MSADDHGSFSTYTNHNCRCAECRAANVEWQRQARIRRAEALRNGQVVRPHGKYTTYTNYGCRCDECRAANAAVRRKNKQIARSAR